jgi:hypothetical protein
MKCLPPALTALTLSLLAAAPALALDQRQADALCAAWKLDCPEGDTATATGPGKGTGALECKVKGRPVKEGPSVTCKAGKALAWGDWKAGKKHGLQVTMRPNGSWTEERFEDGKQEGRSVEYSADGQLLKDTLFHAGKKHGVERTYEVTGKLLSEDFWDKGVKGKKPESAPKASAQAPKAGAAAAPEPQTATEAIPMAEDKAPEEKTPAPEGEADSQANTPQP